MILLKGIGALRYAGSLATRSTIYAPLFTRRTPHELRGFVTGSPGVRCRFVDGSFGLREWPVSFVLLNIVASFQRFLFSDLREVIPARGMRRSEKLHDADEGSMERGKIRWAGGRANRPNLLSSFWISQFHFCVTAGAVRVDLAVDARAEFCIEKRQRALVGQIDNTSMGNDCCRRRSLVLLTKAAITQHTGKFNRAALKEIPTRPGAHTLTLSRCWASNNRGNLSPYPESAHIEC